MTYMFMNVRWPAIPPAAPPSRRHRASIVWHGPLPVSLVGNMYMSLSKMLLYCQLLPTLDDVYARPHNHARNQPLRSADPDGSGIWGQTYVQVPEPEGGEVCPVTARTATVDSAGMGCEAGCDMRVGGVGGGDTRATPPNNHSHSARACALSVRARASPRSRIARWAIVYTRIHKWPRLVFLGLCCPGVRLVPLRLTLRVLHRLSRRTGRLDPRRRRCRPREMPVPAVQVRPREASVHRGRGVAAGPV